MRRGSRLNVIDTVFIDAGGVLVNPNWERVAAALRAQGIDADAAQLAAGEPAAKRVLDDPARVRSSDDRSRAGAFWSLVLEHAGIDAPPAARARAFVEIDAYHQTHNLWENVLPGVAQALALLRANGYRRVLVSNSNGTVIAKLERLELAAFFDVMIDSHEVGVEKPDPRIFDIALARSGARAAQVVHVGDLYEIDVIGARAAGLAAVLLDPNGLYCDKDCPRSATLLDFAKSLPNRAIP
jgi:HAD superfamily hydrolase (TIGR01509 family)